jgi:antitoxin VapB
MRTAKLFQNGRSQAVRLPREYRFKGKEVYVKRLPYGLLLTQKAPWDLFEEGIEEISAGFLEERVQPQLEVRKS